MHEHIENFKGHRGRGRNFARMFFGGFIFHKLRLAVNGDGGGGKVLGDSFRDDSFYASRFAPCNYERFQDNPFFVVIAL